MYIVMFILLLHHVAFEEISSWKIEKQVVQESLKASPNLQCVYISIPVFVSIKENINDLLGGLLEAILSFRDCDWSKYGCSPRSY